LAVSVALEGRIVAAAFNQPISKVDPTAHAEIGALRLAAQTIGNYRLTGATLCVTVEPCAMCVGAMMHARIGTLVYGTAEPKTGAVRSTLGLIDDPSWNHRITVVGGLMAEECRELLQEFFKEKRKRKNE
jgi:tRNA(adenine34) deaminase